MKLYISFLTIFIFAVSVFGQSKPETCVLNISESPVLRGVKLRMSPQEISNALGAAIEPQKKLTEIHLKKVGDDYSELSYGAEGYAENVQKLEMDESFYFGFRNKLPPSLEGIDHVYFNFYKDKLYSFSIFYDASDYQWKDPKEFLEINEEKMGLPKGLWSSQKPYENISSLYCVNFTAYVSVDPKRLSIHITDTSTSNFIQSEAKKKAIESLKQNSVGNLDKKKTFKP